MRCEGNAYGFTDENVMGDKSETFNREMYAQMASRVLTSPEYVDKLVRADRTLAEKLRNRISDVIETLRSVTSKDIEIRKQLRRATKAQGLFERALGAGEAAGKVAYSYEMIDGIGYVRAEDHSFEKEDGTPMTEREIFNSLVGKKIHLPDGDVEIVKRLPEKDMYNELYRRYPKNLKNVENARELNSEVNRNMEELIENSSMKAADVEDADGKHSKQGVETFDTRHVKFYDGKKAYDIEFSIAKLQNGEKVAYAKKYYGYDAELTKKIQAAEGRSEKSPFNQQPDDNSIPQNPEMSTPKSDFSLENVSEEADRSADRSANVADRSANVANQQTSGDLAFGAEDLYPGWGEEILPTRERSQEASYEVSSSRR